MSLTRLCMNQDRIFPAYYLVGFHGRDFAEAGVGGCEYVYRSGNGRSPESVKDFTDRIKAAFPDAQVVNTPDLPPEHVLTADFSGQFIQIITLSPSSESERDPDAPPSESERELDAVNELMPMRVRRYRQNNDVRVFTYSRVYKERDANKIPEEKVSHSDAIVFICEQTPQ